MTDRKRSWREIDQARIRNEKLEKKVSVKDERAKKLESSQARRDLEKLFGSSKLSKGKKDHLDRIKSLRGKPEYYDELKRYREQYDVPREWEAQALFLDHKDPQLVIEVLDRLIATAPRQELRQQSMIASKLKVMALSTFDDQVLDKIKELQKALMAKS